MKHLKFIFLLVILSFPNQVSSQGLSQFWLTTIESAGIEIYVAGNKDTWCQTEVRLHFVSKNPSTMQNPIALNNGLSRIAELLQQTCPQLQTVSVIGKDTAALNDEYQGIFSDLNSFGYSEPVVDLSNTPLIIAGNTNNASQARGFKDFLSDNLHSERLIDGSIVATIDAGEIGAYNTRGEYNFHRFGFDGGRSVSKNFHSKLQNLLRFTANPDLLNQPLLYPNQLASLIGDDVLREYIVFKGNSHVFRGDDEFEAFDTQNKFNSEIVPLIMNMAPTFPLRLKTLSTFFVKEYSRVDQGFHIEIEHLIPLGGLNRTNPNSGIATLREEFFFSIDEQDAREFLNILKEGRLEERNPDSRRSGIIVTDYTLNNVKFENDAYIIDLERTNLSAFSNVTLTRKIEEFSLSQIGTYQISQSNHSSDAAENAGEIIRQTIGFENFLNTHLHPSRYENGRILASIWTSDMEEDQLLRYGLDNSYDANVFPRILSILLALNADPSLLSLDTGVIGFDWVDDLLGGGVADRYIENSNTFLGEDEFARRDMRAKFVQDQAPAIAAMAPNFPIQLSSIVQFSFNEYDYAKSGFRIRIPSRDLVGLHNFSSDAIYQDEIFWSLDEESARNILAEWRDHGDTGFRDERIGYLKIEYSLNSIDLQLQEHNGSSRIDAFVDITKIDVYSDGAVSNFVTQFPVGMIFELPDTPIETVEVVATIPNRNETLDVLGVEAGISLVDAYAILFNHYGSRAVRYDMLDPVSLLGKSIVAVQASTNVFSDEDKIGALGTLEQLSINQVPFPGTGVAFHVLDSEGIKEEITVFASTVTPENDVVSVARYLNLDTSPIDVSLIADRVIQKYGAPDYRWDTGDEGALQTSLIWAELGTVGEILGTDTLHCTNQYDKLFENRGRRNNADEFLTAYAEDFDRPLYELQEAFQFHRNEMGAFAELFEMPWVDGAGERPQYGKTSSLRPEEIQNDCGVLLSMTIQSVGIWSTLVDTSALITMGNHMTETYEANQSLQLDDKQQASSEVAF